MHTQKKHTQLFITLVFLLSITSLLLAIYFKSKTQKQITFIQTTETICQTNADYDKNSEVDLQDFNLFKKYYISCNRDSSSTNCKDGDLTCDLTTSLEDFIEFKNQYLYFSKNQKLEFISQRPKLDKFLDDFENNDNHWKIVREDTDDVNNSILFEENAFIMRIAGRWDYAISSPLVEAPDSDYKIAIKAKIKDPDPINSYGIIFGADWDGNSVCPDVANNYITCFNQYYRLNIIYKGSEDYLSYELKKIDSHDGKNSGKGMNLIQFTDIATTNASDWHKWAVSIHADGNIMIYLDSELVGQYHDAELLANSYFGLFASTDEWFGTWAYFDYIDIQTIND